MSNPSNFPAEKSAAKLWQGGYVSRELSVQIHSDSSSTVAVEDLVGLALRRNPKRAHLLVSTVLGKHIPTEPDLVIGAGELLGAYVAQLLLESSGDAAIHSEYDAGTRAPLLAEAAASLTTALRSTSVERSDAIANLSQQVARLRTHLADGVVLGYAETATGLGRLVANSLGAYYLHSTRHETPEIEAAAGFEEGHSHASSHRLVPTDPHWLKRREPVILVDDEISTGSTLINTIRELHALVPHSQYVVAALIDLRSAADRERFDDLAAELGCSLSVAALGTGWIDLGDDILARAEALIAGLSAAQDAAEENVSEPAVSEPAVSEPAGTGKLTMIELGSEDVTPVRSDRFGNEHSPSDADILFIAAQLEQFLAREEAADPTRALGPLLVIGCEENMYLPLAVASKLAALRPELSVRFSTSTRSPIVPIDVPDYAIAGALSFDSHDLTVDGYGPRFAYNLNGSQQRNGTIVLFPEPGITRSQLIRGTFRPGPHGIAQVFRAAANNVVAVLLTADVPNPAGDTGATGTKSKTPDSPQKDHS